MANLIIQENGVPRTTPAVHGEEITIQAPCDCSAVTGVQIASVAYPFYDAAGNPMASGSGLFAANSLIRVLIDTVNVRSTIINPAIPTPDVSGQINTHNTDPSAHEDIRQAIANKKSATGVSVTLSTAWTEQADGSFAQTVNVTGVTADSSVVADCALSGTDIDADIETLNAWGCVNRAMQSSGRLTFYCYGDTPTVAIPLNVVVM